MKVMRNSFFLLTIFHTILSLKIPPLNTCPGNNFVPRPHSDKVPEVGLNTFELIQYYGYPVERHRDVQTSDGYLLEMHRIPSKAVNGTNKPVLLMHGIIASSSDWVLMGPERSLAFLLADLGYDVWMGNARGNVYSRRHVVLNPDKDADFWDFSWHEIGVYDLPAMIDYILLKTNVDSLIYVGHSQGTTVFFVMASIRTDYNRKIRYMGALAPAAYVPNMISPVFRIPSLFERSFEILLNLIGLYEFLPSCRIIQQLGQALCNDKAPTQGLCGNLMFIAAGFDPPQLNYTRIPVMLSNLPAGIATKQLLHAFQIVNTSRFCQFDYNPIKNKLIYGSPTPPDYNLGAVTAPVGLYYASNDWLVQVVDVLRTRSELGNPVINYLVPYSKFNHFDFLYAIDVVPLLYDRLIADIESYS